MAKDIPFTYRNGGCTFSNKNFTFSWIFKPFFNHIPQPFFQVLFLLKFIVHKFPIRFNFFLKKKKRSIAINSFVAVR